MLLETLDLRINDVLIYSQNQFNFSENFKIVHKNAKVKKPQSISYFDVCNYLKEAAPKNVILYRLLTNVNNLDAFSTKYGYFIKLNGKMELVYFDPIFAIKDLKHLKLELDPAYFRFKIQQVGLTSLTKWENEPNYSEVYSFDLKAVEAQNQNDKIFADAIFAFDPSFTDQNIDMPRKDTQTESNTYSQKKTETSDASFEIAEDKNPNKPNLNLPQTPNPAQVLDVRDEIISLLKQALNIHEQNNSALRKNIANDAIADADTQTAVNLLDLFKSTNKSEGFALGNKENVILKFEKKKSTD